MTVAIPIQAASPLSQQLSLYAETSHKTVICAMFALLLVMFGIIASVHLYLMLATQAILLAGMMLCTGVWRVTHDMGDDATHATHNSVTNASSVLARTAHGFLLGAGFTGVMSCEFGILTAVYQHHE